MRATREMRAGSFPDSYRKLRPCRHCSSTAMPRKRPRNAVAFRSRKRSGTAAISFTSGGCSGFSRSEPTVTYE